MRPLATVVLALVLALLAPAAAAAQTAAVEQSSAEEVRLERETSRIASELRCPVCQGLSIEDSPSDMARDMRGIVKEQLAEGKSADEVKEFFVGGYGEWILMSPRAEGFNLAVYILPIIALLAGAAIVVVLTKRWTRASAAPAAPVVEDPELAAWEDVSRS
jgi:cytochrome c-type biogenesis protein CcmH